VKIRFQPNKYENKINIFILEKYIHLSKKNMKKILYLLLFTGLNFSGYAQVKETIFLPEVLKNVTGMRKVTLPNNNIAYISNDNDGKVEIDVYDTNLKSIWTKTFSGNSQAVTLFGDNLLFFETTDKTLMNGSNSEFKAFLINPTDGAILKQEILFSGNNNYVTIPYLLVCKDNKSFYFGIRETNLKRGVKIGFGVIATIATIKKIDDNGNKINSFRIKKFDNNLKETSEYYPDLQEGDLMNLALSPDEKLFIATSKDSEIKVSKYDFTSPKPVKVLSEYVSFDSGLFKMDRVSNYLKITTDSVNKDVVYLVGTLDNRKASETIFNKYDFAKGNIKTFSQIYDKDMLKELEKSYTLSHPDLKKVSYLGTGGMKLEGFNIIEGNYYLCIGYNSLDMRPSSGPSFTNSMGLVFLKLDKNLDLQYSTAIPRMMNSVYSARISLVQKNNEFYLFTNHEKKGTFISCNINLADGKIKALQVISPSKAATFDISDVSNIHLVGKDIIIPLSENKVNSFGTPRANISLVKYTVN
jgi:WD40 repeat protein